MKGFYIIALIAAPLIAAQDIECYKCKGDHKDDSCFDTDFLINGSGNETMSEKCNEGCMIQTRIGKKNGDRFDEIERGCIPKLEHTVGCDTDSKDGDEEEKCYSECFESFCNSSVALKISVFLAFLLFTLF